MNNQTKMCTNCFEKLPLDEFYNNKTKRQGKSDWCICCHRNYYGRKAPEEELTAEDMWKMEEFLDMRAAYLYRIGEIGYEQLTEEQKKYLRNEINELREKFDNKKTTYTTK